MPKRSRRVLDGDEEDDRSEDQSNKHARDEEDVFETHREDDVTTAGETPTQEDDLTPGRSSSLNQANIDDYLFNQLSTREREVATAFGVKLCKAAIAAELKNQVITKGYITKHVLGDERGLKFAHIYKVAQIQLSKLGFELVPLPTKDQKDVIDVARAGQFLNSSYVVRSILNKEYQDVISSYFVRLANDDYETPNALGSVVLIVCLIALHKNNLGKKELESLCLKFGMGGKVLEEYVKKAMREEYIVQEKISNGETNRPRARRRAGNNEDDFVAYHIGRRARAEFSKDELIAFLRELYGDKDNFDDAKAQISLAWF